MPFCGTLEGTKAHLDKNCSGLRKAKKIYKIKLEDYFDILPCQLCFYKGIY